MLAVLSSSDAQTGDHAKLLLEERVPTLNCCKQRFENPGGGWQTCSSTFQPLWFFLSFVVVVVVSYQFILCSKVEKHPWTSSSIFRLPASPFVHCREHRQEESFSPGGTLWGGAGFTAAAERINYWWTPPLPPDWNPTKPPSQGTAGGKKKSPVTVLVPQRPTAWL